MNTKRQTIWLVSMLSLMVVLSAYYLFTQDKDASNVLTDGTQTEQAEGTTEADASADPNGQGEAVAETESEGQALTEEEILGLTGVPSTAVFGEIMEKSQEQFNEEYDSLMKEIANTSDNTAEQSSEAVTQLNELEERKEKLSSLQTQLEEKFANAVVDDTQPNHYKVVVQSEKLEKTEAVGIIDLVVKTLGVPAEQVAVQYVP
ncbi:SpoIIIAH-like family protein [Paenibacillus thailandensis]|uniref:SpoIIIAH-like family protein n=1 Tax=Paenibacillus thailandensis TaxID=393250 RepID=A0ABW5QYY2_9BACL